MTRRTALVAVALLAAGCFGKRAEPPRTERSPVPASVALVGLPSTMDVGDSASVTVALLDADSTEIYTAPADWEVRIIGGLAYQSDSGFTNVVRAEEAGFGAVQATHESSGLNTQVVTQIADTATVAPPDMSLGQVGELGDSAIVAPEPGQWPDNEPPGMTTLTHVRGGSKDWPGWEPFGSWEDPARVAVVEDPDAKYGKAVEKRFKMGDASGWGDPQRGAFRGPGQTFGHRLQKEVYIRLVFKYSPDWDFHSGGEKLWTPNVTGRYVGTSIQLRNGTVFVTAGFEAMTDREYSYWLPILPGRSPHTSLASPIGRGPYAKLRRDVYHTVEVVRRMNDPGQANGYIRFWIDGVEYTRFANIGDPVGSSSMTDVSLLEREWSRTLPGISTRIECCLYWGGQNDEKTLDDWLRISEFYVSGK